VIRVPARRAVPRLATLVLAVVAVAAGGGVPPRAAHGAEVKGKALLDLVAASNTDARPLNWDDEGTSAFDPYSLRLFGDASVTKHLEGHAQVLYREAIGLRLIGAYALYTPWLDQDLHLAAGKIPWWIGTYADREYSDENPLVGTPLLYQYRTPLRWYEIDPSVDALLANAGRLPGGGRAPAGPVYPIGMPIVWESWWDVGVMALGSVRPVEFSLGVVSGTPGWGSPGEEENEGKSFLGRVGLAPHPAVRFGVSGSIGPYPMSFLSFALPPGKSPEDYDQELVLADAEILIGHAELRGEGYANTWETPYVGNLHVRGYYVEGKYSLPEGFWVAGRWEIERFSKVTDSTGLAQPWDVDRNRAEVGLGYRVSKDVFAKAVFQRNHELAANAFESPDDKDLLAAQLVVRF
jgi:hypothetical protein